MKEILFVCLFLFTTISSIAQCKLTVNVSGLRNANGSVCFFLYNNAQGFPDKSKNVYRQGIVDDIKNSSVQYTFSNIPAGRYAVALVHDEDNNHKLNTNWLGIPTEGVGASNNARSSFGPPKFNAAAFILTKDTAINIKMWYFSL